MHACRLCTFCLIHAGNYATLFNLGHPEIRKQIEPSLKKAQEDMRNGKKFCVEVSFLFQISIFRGSLMDTVKIDNFKRNNALLKFAL